MSQISAYIANRYLWSKRSEAFITILTAISIIGVALGVMVLNITMAIMTGFQYEFTNKMSTANAHITVRSVLGPIENWQEVSSTIKSVPGVTGSAPFTSNQALLKLENRSLGILVRGVQKGTFAAETLAKFTSQRPQSISELFEPPLIDVITEDGQDDKAQLPGIFIGKTLANSYGLTEGQTISMFSPQVSSSPLGLLPKFKRFVISGIYDAGYHDFEQTIAYISIPEAQSFFKLADKVQGVEAWVDDLPNVKSVKAKINETLSSKMGAGYVVHDWSDSNKEFWNALELEKRVYFLVLLLLVLLASFSIVSTLVMLVIEKRKDIAVLKTLGATDASVSKIFMRMGTIIGGIGTSIGLILGYLGCMALKIYGFPLKEEVFQMSQVPVHIDPINFLIVGVVSFLICACSTWYPARRASALHPSEVLRG